MAKRFCSYTDAELLGLSNEELNDAVRIEGIERGFLPPMPFSEALRKSEWRGYQKPAEAIEVYEIVIANSYGSPTASGLAFLSKERAQAAAEGAFSLEHTSYGKDQGYKIHSRDAQVLSRWVGVSEQQQSWAKLEEYQVDTPEFDKVRDECLEKFSAVRQADYNRRVNLEKKVEYLRLAGGDETIAQAFWGKVEKSSWPI